MAKGCYYTLVVIVTEYCIVGDFLCQAIHATHLGSVTDHSSDWSGSNVIGGITINSRWRPGRTPSDGAKTNQASSWSVGRRIHTASMTLDWKGSVMMHHSLYAPPITTVERHGPTTTKQKYRGQRSSLSKKGNSAPHTSCPSISLEGPKTLCHRGLCIPTSQLYRDR
jgi:hypothetical protein